MVHPLPRCSFENRSRSRADQGSELNKGCAGLNQGSAAQMVNWGNRWGSEAIKPPLDDNFSGLKANFLSSQKSLAYSLRIFVDNFSLLSTLQHCTRCLVERGCPVKPLSR